jgi:hypothetical protein
MDTSASLEDRRLLNPAFAGLLVVRASQGFSKQSGGGLPFVYAYLVLPLVLHSETRERLPHAIVTKLLSWAERNGDLVALLPRRVVELGPATREGLFVVLTAGLSNLGLVGQIEPAIDEKSLIGFERNSTSAEVAECVKKAYFVGRWLATSGTVPTVLTALGVRLENHA